MDRPLVSVITPAYNAENSILDAYNSLLLQQGINFEWIVVDDCSQDRTAQIINQLILKNPWIKYKKTDANKGAASARNIGIEIAQGRYIAFLDADDIWKEGKLIKQISFMQNNDIAFSCTNYDVKRGSKTHLFRPKHSKITYKSLLKTCNIGCLTVIYDTKKIGKIFMPLDAPKREDHATWLDITKRNIPCYRFDDNLATYLISDVSVSSKKAKMFKYQYLLYRKHERMGIVRSFYYTLCVTMNKIFRKYH